MVRGTSNRNKLEEIGVKNFDIGDMLDKFSLKNALSSGYGFDVVTSAAVIQGIQKETAQQQIQSATGTQ